MKTGSVSIAINLAIKLEPAQRVGEELVEAMEMDKDQEAKVATEDGAGRMGSTPGRQALSTTTVPMLEDLGTP